VSGRVWIKYSSIKRLFFTSIADYSSKSQCYLSSPVPSSAEGDRGRVVWYFFADCFPVQLLKLTNVLLDSFRYLSLLIYTSLRRHYITLSGGVGGLPATSRDIWGNARRVGDIVGLTN